MGSCCCPFASKKTDEPSQAKEMTLRGDTSPVARCKSTMAQLMTHKERTGLLDNSALSLSSKLLLNPPFANFSAFNQQLYLTGIGGITLDNLKQYHIKCLVNVAEEIPPLFAPGQKFALLYHKFPFIDSYSFPVGDLLSKVADVIHKVLKEKDGNVVVFCTAGMSRSCTAVLAYAIKHLKMPLKEAFSHLQEVRTYARPNLHFFQQLVQFELECQGTNSVEMVQETMEMENANQSNSEKQRKKTKRREEPLITVPNCYKKDYPHLFKMEVQEALAGNCPMASTGPAGSSSSTLATSKVSSKAKSSKTSKQKSANMKAGLEPVYLNNELKPYMVEVISYKAFLAELDKARKKKPPMPHAVSTGYSLKTKY